MQRRNESIDDRPVDDERPRVTIGMPVRNEARFLHRAIESIVAQSCSDFEVIISDNASEDETASIAQAYARRDNRIRYVRQPKNVGAIENFNIVMRAAKGEFFLIVAGHDILSIDYLAVLVRGIEEDDRAVLTFGEVVWIDKEGTEIPRPKKLFIDMSGITDPVTRFNLVMWGDPNMIYGLIRLDALRKTNLVPRTLVPGVLLLGELAILGGFVYVEDACWYRRMNRDPETREARIRRYCDTFFARPRRRILPYWRIPFLYLYSTLTIPLKGPRRLRTRLLLAVSAFSSIPRYWYLMAEDLARLIHRPGKRSVTGR